MDTIESLIAEGKNFINEYNKTPKKAYSCVRGLNYEAWMGKVKCYADSKLKEYPIKTELDDIYRKRNNYLGTTAVESALGVLCAIQSTNPNMMEKGINMKVFISHSSKDKVYGDILVDLLKGLGLKREEIIYTSNEFMVFH